MVSAADGVSKNLPRSLDGRMREDIEAQLAPDRLRFLAECAAFGLSQDGGIAGPGSAKPPNAHSIDGWSGNWPGLVELVGSRIVEPLKRLSDPKPPASSITEISPMASSFGDGAPAPVEPQPFTGGGAAPIHGVRPSIAGVVIRNGAMTNSTERMAPPVPYVPETATTVAGEQIDDVVTDEADEEILAPAASVTPRYTEQSEAF
jgi:hypothetical protein